MVGALRRRFPLLGASSILDWGSLSGLLPPLTASSLSSGAVGGIGRSSDEPLVWVSLARVGWSSSLTTSTLSVYGVRGLIPGLLYAARMYSSSPEDVSSPSRKGDCLSLILVGHLFLLVCFSMNSSGGLSMGSESHGRR